MLIMNESVKHLNFRISLIRFLINLIGCSILKQHLNLTMHCSTRLGFRGFANMVSPFLYSYCLSRFLKSMPTTTFYLVSTPMQQISAVWLILRSMKGNRNDAKRTSLTCFEWTWKFIKEALWVFIIIWACTFSICSVFFF